MDLQTLDSPTLARKFLDELDIPGHGKVRSVVANDKKTIYFNEMDDAEVVKYAKMVYSDIVEPATKKRRQ